MDISEFLEWYTYYRLTKFADEIDREGYNAITLLQQSLINMQSSERHRPESIFPDPFAPKEAMNWKQLKAVFQMSLPCQMGRIDENGISHTWTPGENIG